MTQRVLGLVLELNPFHTGHKYFIEQAKKKVNPDITIAIISSSFSMRGDIMIMDKFSKAKLAIENGIDIVLELPFISCVCSADYFAYNSIKQLTKLGITDFCCGVENTNLEELKYLADLTLDNNFNAIIKKYIEEGNSYSSSFNKALNEYSVNKTLIESFSLPNNTLAIQYLNAFKKLNYNCNISLIKRLDNNYYDSNLTSNFSSATSLRKAIINKDNLAYNYLIDKNYNYIDEKFAYQKMLSILKSKFILEDISKISNILEVNEGIENRIKSSLEKSNTYDELLDNCITKRYNLNKIKRTLLNILFDINKDTFSDNNIDYLRVLAFNNNGINYINNINKDIKKSIITSLKNKNDSVSLLELKVTKLYSLLTNQSDLYKQEFLIPFKFANEGEIK